MAASADLYVASGMILPISRVDPGTKMTYSFNVYDSGPDPANARLTLQFPAGTRFVGVSELRWQCSANAAAVVVCTRRLEPSAYGHEPPLDIDIIAPEDPRGVNTTVKAQIESDVPDPNPGTNVAYALITVYRTFMVNTPNDFGAGSLRATIEQANAECDGDVPCKIRFDRAMRILPRTPLPALSNCNMTIDGGTYYELDPVPLNRYFDVPRRVELAGDDVNSGSGILVASTCNKPYLAGITVRGLAIGGFPENGVEVRGDASVSVEGCFIGTNANGTAAAPNALRGISANAPKGFLVVSNSLIGANGRSGIAMWSIEEATLYGNLIGVRFGGIPMPNGASGVYVDRAHKVRSQKNAIEYNREFGFAIGPHAAHVASDGDYIIANGGLALDWGLDGPSGGQSGMPSIPRLTDAFFDPAAGGTVVRGVYVPPAAGYANVRLFLTDGDYEGGLLLPQLGVTTKYTPVEVQFEILLQGDRTGKRISAQSIVYPSAFDPFIDSSEFSASIVVR
jgi:hypothetical protein